MTNRIDEEALGIAERYDYSRKLIIDSINKGNQSYNSILLFAFTINDLMIKNNIIN
jgi:hypothetical protein